MEEIRIVGSQGVIANSTISAQGDVLVNGQKITNIYYSAQYQDLKNQRNELDANIATTQQRIEKYPNDKGFQAELLAIDNKRKEVQNKIDELKNEVIRLAETFAKISIDTERMELAQQYFNKGDYTAARAILDAEQIGDEQKSLLRKKAHQQQQLVETEKLLINNANEFLILARLTALNFDLPNRFEKTLECFEQSLKAAHTQENTFAYAYYLQQHNQFSAATPFYQEALTFYRCLAETNPQTYLPYVAMTLNNLAVLLKDKNEFPAAEAAYQEALGIYRRLAETNPQTYLPDVAMTLNNLANLQSDKNEFPAAEAAYQEALEIRRRLAETNPQTYLPYVMMTAVNMSIFYLQSVPDREMSLAHAKEALVAGLPFVALIPGVQKDLSKALQVAEEWKLDRKAFWEEAVKVWQYGEG
ncbi:MAG: hypothetical protein NMNS01_26010 [Nitrosomonas sp.]|nr:MAG: hypothetical protein NMNS01_26010 [Nitrosomonas sp.]